MRFCQDHWDRLREAIEARELSDLIAPDGRVAMEQMVDQLERGQRGEAETITPVNYDPLMAAHWAVINNVTHFLQRAGGGSAMLYWMGGDESTPEDPVEGHPGRTWPRCPLCYINLAHEISCTDPRCSLPRVGGYDWMIDRAADEEAKNVEKMRENAA